MKKYGRAMERKYMCATCKKTFIYLTDFRTHTYIHPQKQPLVIASRDGEAARYELVDRFKCKQCDASFYFKSQLWHHRRLKHNDKNTSSWVCPVCDQKFDGAVTFKKHSEAVHGITHAFICPTCGKRLRTNIKLTEHSYKHLPPEKHPFYCKLCQKGIPTSGKYKDHMQMHANKREYTCKICNKSFNTATVLQCHRRTHSDKSSWHKCPDCDKSFLYKHRLDAHRITHNKDAGFRCDLCGKVFTRERALEKHKRFHITGSRHECFICEQHFKSAKEISDHLDKEHGCDKLVCQICQASFISKHALMSHMKAHVKRLKENQAKSADLLSSKAVEDAARPPDSSNSEQVENAVKSIDLSNSKEVENLVKSVDSSSSKEVKNDPKHSCNNPTDHSGTKEKEMQQSSNERPIETSSTILESSGSVERILHCGAPSLDALIDQSIGSDGRNNEKSSQSLLFQNTISSKIAQSSANQDKNISEDNFSLSIEDLVPIEDRIQEL